MTKEIELPPPSWRGHYSAGDMLAYAAAAVAAERERFTQPVQPAQQEPMFTKPQLEIIKASVTDSADINPHQEYEDIIQRVDDLLRDC